MHYFRRLRSRARIKRPANWNWDRISLVAASLVGLLLAVYSIRLFNDRVQPILITAAQANTKNAISRIVTEAVGKALAEEALGYRDMITLEKDNAGQITALTSNTLAMNRLRVDILGDVLEQVDSLDSHTLGIPLGELTGLTILSGRGPSLPVRIRSVGAASAEFRNVFTSAGVNQTHHQIILEVSVDAALLIPGGTAETTVVTQICIAETVLVGEVPQTYLQLGLGEGS